MSRATADGSMTSPRRGRSPSRRPRRRGDSDREGIVQRVVKEIGGSAAYPALTKSNYNDWALMMRVMLQARGLWEAVETGDVDFQEDRTALEAILRAVPPEMISTLAVKATAKEAWDAIKTMRVGMDRVRKASAQRVRREYEAILFRDGESVDDFAMRLNGLVSQLATLGDPERAHKLVERYLRAASPRFPQLVLSIETLLDISTLSVEDITGRLKTVEDRGPTNGREVGSRGSSSSGGKSVAERGEGAAVKRKLQMGEMAPSRIWEKLWKVGPLGQGLQVQVQTWRSPCSPRRGGVPAACCHVRLCLARQNQRAAVT